MVVLGSPNIDDRSAAGFLVPPSGDQSINTSRHTCTILNCSLVYIYIGNITTSRISSSGNDVSLGLEILTWPFWYFFMLLWICFMFNSMLMMLCACSGWLFYFLLLILFVLFVQKLFSFLIYVSFVTSCVRFKDGIHLFNKQTMHHSRVSWFVSIHSPEANITLSHILQTYTHIVTSNPKGRNCRLHRLPDIWQIMVIFWGRWKK